MAEQDMYVAIPSHKLMHKQSRLARQDMNVWILAHKLMHKHNIPTQDSNSFTQAHAQPKHCTPDFVQGRLWSRHVQIKIALSQWKAKTCLGH